MSAALRTIEQAVGHLDSDENEHAIQICMSLAGLDEIYSALKGALDRADLEELAASLEADGYGD